MRNLGKSFVANTLPADLFRADIDDETVRGLFRRYVRQVEIENHNYCNRTCSFCPNAQLDRRSTTQLMTDELFEKILSALEGIRYDQMFIWARYHEPMAHPSFFDRLAEARRRLPHAQLVVISNGDYLDRAKLELLEASKLDRLWLNLYLPDGKERDPGELDRALRQFQARTGLVCVEDGSKWQYNCEGTTVCATMGVPHYSYATGISTRGGLVTVPELGAYQRRAACFRPLHSVVVDFNGKGMLCCEVRSDAPEHATAVIGDLSRPGYSLFDFYRDLAPARLALVSPGPKTGVCRTCTSVDGGPDRTARRPAVASVLGRIQPLTLVGEWGTKLERAAHRRK
ncbi:MAG: hypothetical protein A3F70_03700 [Acidobacteria bacterium RIFCSPLOWO2_12_FULL_67_14]|nr:MAG: hypothetical protein A3H29_15930 [Acidobacteria bacterium RIFCSPLOWO2_02_FULL_67_21]OFW40101.1 MAG: hypothetical protein A3F70_03700 [Acidobacteria bacterium RIFCSPLOWO2_12_FULL_67_14]